MTILDRPHTTIELDGPCIDFFDLPVAVWEYCRDLVADVDGSEWDEIAVRDTVILDAVEAVTFWKVLSAEIVCVLDDLTCWLCVWLDMPDVEKHDGIHGDWMENSLVFDLGIKASIPEAWFDYSTAKAA